jgi:hypothetical protein
MDWTGPCKNAYHSQTVERNISEVSAVDLKASHGFAVAVGGQRIELARTAIVAITTRELVCLNFPGCHGRLLNPFFNSTAGVNRHCDSVSVFLLSNNLRPFTHLQASLKQTGAASEKEPGWPIDDCD